MKLALAAFVLAACVDPGSDWQVPAIDPPSFSTGVYGQLRSGCDTVGCEVGVIADHEVTISLDDDHRTTVMTGADGGYAVELAPGTYRICVFSCTTFEVIEGAVTRVDFETGPGGGLWCDDAGRCEPGE